MRIGFAGKMRAGKDTCAEYLIKKYGGKRIGFSDPLYEMQESIYEIAGLPKQKDRFLLQFLGTDWGRKTIDQDIWINIMDKRLQKITEKENQKKEHYLFDDFYDDNLFITDVRFPNEVATLKKHNFKVFSIVRPDEERIKFGATNLTHESETMLDIYSDFDGIIYNEGSLEDLHNKLDELIK